MSCPTAIRILRLAWNRLTFALGPTFAMGAPPPIHFLPARDLGDRAGLKFWDTWLLPSFRALRVLETRSFKYYKVPSLAQLKYCKMCRFYNQMCLSWIWVAVWVPSVEPEVMRKTYVFSYTSVHEGRLSCGLGYRDILVSLFWKLNIPLTGQSGEYSNFQIVWGCDNNTVGVK